MNSTADIRWDRAKRSTGKWAHQNPALVSGLIWGGFAFLAIMVIALGLLPYLAATAGVPVAYATLISAFGGLIASAPVSGAVGYVAHYRHKKYNNGDANTPHTSPHFDLEGGSARMRRRRDQAKVPVFDNTARAAKPTETSFSDKAALPTLSWVQSPAVSQPHHSSDVVSNSTEMFEHLCAPAAANINHSWTKTPWRPEDAAGNTTETWQQPAKISSLPGKPRQPVGTPASARKPSSRRAPSSRARKTSARKKQQQPMVHNLMAERGLDKRPTVELVDNWDDLEIPDDGLELPPHLKPHRNGQESDDEAYNPLANVFKLGSGEAKVEVQDEKEWMDIELPENGVLTMNPQLRSIGDDHHEHMYDGDHEGEDDGISGSYLKPDDIPLPLNRERETETEFFYPPAQTHDNQVPNFAAQTAPVRIHRTPQKKRGPLDDILARWAEAPEVSDSPQSLARHQEEQVQETGGYTLMSTPERKPYRTIRRTDSFGDEVEVVLQDDINNANISAITPKTAEVVAGVEAVHEQQLSANALRKAMRTAHQRTEAVHHYVSEEDWSDVEVPDGDQSNMLRAVLNRRLAKSHELSFTTEDEADDPPVAQVPSFSSSHGDTLDSSGKAKSLTELLTVLPQELQQLREAQAMEELQQLREAQATEISREEDDFDLHGKGTLRLPRNNKQPRFDGHELDDIFISDDSGVWDSDEEAIEPSPFLVPPAQWMNTVASGSESDSAVHPSRRGRGGSLKSRGESMIAIRHKVPSKKKPQLLTQDRVGHLLPKKTDKMVWNETDKCWEGNEEEMVKFNRPTGPFLIQNLNTKNAAKVVNNMVYDPLNLRWIGNDSEEDVFADFTTDEEFDNGQGCTKISPKSAKQLRDRTLGQFQVADIDALRAQEMAHNHELRGWRLAMKQDNT